MYRRFILFLMISASSVSALSAKTGDAEALRELMGAAGAKGGLAIVLGCDPSTGSGQAILDKMIEAVERGPYLVQFLDTDAKKVAKAREYIQEKGLYGPVSANVYDGKNLPYIDNLANLVVVNAECRAPSAELFRILAPRGVAIVEESFDIRKSEFAVQYLSERKRKLTKPVPKDTDEWSHWLHGPDNNAVANDKEVDVPRHLQWIQDPIWISSHNLNPGVSAMVTSGGRLFSIINEMPPGIGGMDDKWILTARDAFNGLVLWKRPIKDWGWKHWAEYEYKVEMRFVPPFQVMRRMVASDDMIFVTPGFYSPVHVLDSASGEEIKVLEGTEKTFEILHVDGLLFLAVNDSIGTDRMIPAISIMAVDPKKGKIIWKTGGFRGVSGKLNSLYKHANAFMTAGSGKIILLDGDELVCLDQENGREKWRAKRPGKRLQLTDEDIESLAQSIETSGNIPSYRASQYLPNNCALVHSDGVVVLTEIKDELKNFKSRLMKTGYTIAYDAKSGRELWRFDCVTFAHFVPPDLFVINGLVWTLDGTTKSYVGLDLRTGETKKSYAMTDMIWNVGGHQLCFRNKATSEMLVFGRKKTEFVDIHTGEISKHAWIKGMCNYGVMPANGMIYYPPHNCSCLMPFKLAGFRAQTARGFAGGDSSEQLLKGKAYAKSFKCPAHVDKEGWPMYRGDIARKGSLPASLPTKPALKWTAVLGGALSQVIAVEGKLYVSEKDAHRICCLDKEKGTVLWRHTAGGRIDSAPTYSNGRVVAGCTDGHVYCLDADTGELVWRFRAAPHNASVIAFDQLASAWPVHGSVIVMNDRVYCVAGRSSNLNGGMYLFKLDLKSGNAVQKKKLEPALESNYETRGALLADLLTVDQDSIYMRHLEVPADDIEQVVFRSSASHGPGVKGASGLRATSGFLDTSWFNTAVWGLGSLKGQIMSYDKTHAFGVLAHKSFSNSYRHDVFEVGQEGYLLFCKSLSGTDAAASRRRGAGKKGGKIAYVWSSRIPIRAQSLLVADNCLYLAGMRDAVDEKDRWAHVEGRMGGVLAVYARADGKKLYEIPLSSAPVFDGLSASNGSVFLVTRDGNIRCYN